MSLTSESEIYTRSTSIWSVTFYVYCIHCGIHISNVMYMLQCSTKSHYIVYKISKWASCENKNVTENVIDSVFIIIYSKLTWSEKQVIASFLCNLRARSLSLSIFCEWYVTLYATVTIHFKVTRLLNSRLAQHLFLFSTRIQLYLSLALFYLSIVLSRFFFHFVVVSLYFYLIKFNRMMLSFYSKLAFNSPI